jgi:hypothetical protein
MPDSDKSVFISAVIRIEELNRLRINPNGLGLFEPNPVFFEVRSVLLFIPFKFHNEKSYSIVYTTSTKTPDGNRQLLPTGVWTIDTEKRPKGEAPPFVILHFRLVRGICGSLIRPEAPGSFRSLTGCRPDLTLGRYTPN